MSERSAAETAQEAVMRWMNSSTDVRRHVGTEVVAALAAAGYVILPSVRRAAEARAVSGDEK